MDPNAVFPARQPAPSESALKSALGKTSATLQAIEQAVRTNAPSAEWVWQYSGRSGWYRLLVVKKRRLFYLVPRRGDFRLSLIVGDKALAELKHGPFAPTVTALCAEAKRYPEGTAFGFDGHADPLLIAAFITAKQAH